LQRVVHQSKHHSSQISAVIYCNMLYPYIPKCVGAPLLYMCTSNAAQENKMNATVE
jgi:hypothetical protein